MELQGAEEIAEGTASNFASYFCAVAVPLNIEIEKKIREIQKHRCSHLAQRLPSTLDHLKQIGPWSLSQNSSNVLHVTRVLAIIPPAMPAPTIKTNDAISAALLPTKLEISQLALSEPNKVTISPPKERYTPRGHYCGF
jgi:hypothetical protein